MNKNQKGFATVLIIVLFGLVLTAGGYLIYSSYSKNWRETAPSSDTVTKINNLTKTYKNEDRGYQFDYPEGAEIGSDMGMDFSSDSIFLTSNKEKLPYFGVQSITKTDFLKDKYTIGGATSAYELIKASFDESVSNKNTFIRIIEPINEILFSGKKAYRYRMEETAVEMIYGGSVKEQSIYTFIVLEHNGAFILIASANSVLFDNILLTFKFTGQSSNTDKTYTWIVATDQEKTSWNTYTDSINGFSIQYPKEWRQDNAYVEGEIVLTMDKPCKQCGGVGRGVYISVSDNKNKLGILDYANQILKNNGLGFVIKTQPNYFSNLDVTVIDGMGGAGSPGPLAAIKNKDNKIIILRFDGVEEDMVSKIFSTFKFLDYE